jgi:hypothetical protein
VPCPDVPIAYCADQATDENIAAANTEANFEIFIIIGPPTSAQKELSHTKSTVDKDIPHIGAQGS